MTEEDGPKQCSVGSAFTPNQKGLHRVARSVNEPQDAFWREFAAVVPDNEKTASGSNPCRSSCFSLASCLRLFGSHDATAVTSKSKIRASILPFLLIQALEHDAMLIFVFCRRDW